MATKDNKDDKIFDINKPGKTAPNSSSRPLIVSQRPILHDPMVSTDPDGTTSSQSNLSKAVKHTPSLPSERPKVVPVKVQENGSEHEPINQASGQYNNTQEETENNSTRTSKTKAVKDSSGESVEPLDDEDNNSDIETPEKQAAADRQATKEHEAEKAKLEAIDQLTKDKKYYVSIGKVKRRRGNRRALVVLILVIVLSLVAVDLLIDAGIIRTSFKAPIHIFNNNQ